MSTATRKTPSPGTAADPRSGGGVVDMCSMPAEPEVCRAYMRRLALEAPAYLRIFARGWCRTYGADPDAYRQALREDRLLDAVDVLVDGMGDEFELDAYLAELDENGIGHQVVHGVPAPFGTGSDVNDLLAGLAARAPHRLQAWLGLSLRNPDEALREVRSCPDRGLRGITVNPFLDDVDPADPRYAPVFAAAEERSLPVWLHTGQHFASDRPLDRCSWWHVDRIAVRHPELDIVVGHAGWPWLRELTAVAQRHRRVHLEISSHRPRHFTEPGSGWEPLMSAGRTTIRRKVMFGSSAAVHDVPISRLVDEVRRLGLGEDVEAAWLSGNARRLLALEP
ncbi:amidohydrolase family protein [Streptomyces spiramenti]|uniref:Amidohydrolase n=1 Tax=Streptomyces spiramenti TaxID=2720606 RepID=A0ABX1AND0_9ACTN|nr:amidohydrolase family protein [Streptomyces spiramenti]NJP67606.1 amidohydrolase [Streptomyces spiramenti]